MHEKLQEYRHHLWFCENLFHKKNLFKKNRCTIRGCEDQTDPCTVHFLVFLYCKNKSRTLAYLIKDISNARPKSWTEEQAYPIQCLKYLCEVLLVTDSMLHPYLSLNLNFTSVTWRVSQTLTFFQTHSCTSKFDLSTVRACSTSLSRSRSTVIVRKSQSWKHSYLRTFQDW